MALKMRRNRAPKPPGECPISACMAVIGGAWTPNVIWALRAGPRRFSELRADVHGVSAKVLTQRLRELEARGVLVRRVMPTSPPSVEYELTPQGAELGPAIESIVAVGKRLRERMDEKDQAGS